jgi:hypothetical protein
MRRDEFPIVDAHVKKEVKAVLENVRNRLSQNRIATDRYGDVVMWDDIKRVLEEVNADEDSD